MRRTDRASVGAAAGGPASPGRRGFIGAALVLTGLALTPVPAIAARRGAAAERHAPVVAFHADALYLDHSGTAEPFRPPLGTRSIDGFDEETLRRLAYGW